MARKLAQNLKETTLWLDLSGDTTTVTRAVMVLTRDWVEILAASFVFHSAGTGTQRNITLVFKVGATAVSNTTGNLLSDTANQSASITGNGPQPALAEGARLDVTATFSGATTTGPKVAISVLYRA